ncbi:MAG: hypothetical protein ACR65R_19900 [Methylomicrobium sp.]
MLRITFENREAHRQIKNLESQLDFAVALALTRTAQRAQKELRAEMAWVFDKPTRYAMSSLYIQPATKNNLEARIFFKDEWSVGSQGTPATYFLTPEIKGGLRFHKSSELQLIRAGLLGASQYATPGRDQPLNASGNITGGQWKQILSGMGVARRAPGYEANITRKSKKRHPKRGSVFPLGKPGRVRGIGSRVKGQRLKIRLWFVDRARYQKRFDFYGVGRKVAEDHLQTEFSKAITEAIRTRR